MDNKKLLGRRIKELRKQKHFTQESLSEIIGIEPCSLSAIEIGRHYPSLPTLEKIANSLNLELKKLFEYNHLKTNEELILNIKSELNNVSTEKLALIQKIIEH